MLRVYFASAFTVALLLGAVISAAPSRAESIPPNCTLDPFTHTMHCHPMPGCKITKDRVICPAPKASAAAAAVLQ